MPEDIHRYYRTIAIMHWGTLKMGGVTTPYTRQALIQGLALALKNSLGTELYTPGAYSRPALY